MERGTVYVYGWKNNPTRARLHGRRCVVEAAGALGTVLIRMLDTGERVTTSRRALRRAEPDRRRGHVDAVDQTTMPAPPRRGSPTAANPSGLTATAFTPPK